MEKVYFTSAPAKTKKLGENLAKKILKEGKISKKAKTLALLGDLGGGKTAFLQGFAKGLGIKQKILSPTFVIMKRFPVKKKGPFKNFYHLDCYRVKNSGEVSSLGFKKITKDPQNIIAVEWAEKISKIIPKEKIRIKFNFISDKKRKISIIS